MIATICLYALVSVSESVLVKLSALYLVSKVSQKSSISPPLFITQVYLGHFSGLVKLLLMCRQNNHFNRKASGRSYSLLVNPYY